MTLEEQRQFILEGNMYNDLTEELVKVRENTVLLTNEYNASFGKPAAEREAILAATANPARSIGIYDRTGSVHTGKEADLLLVTENFELKRVI